MKNRKRSDEEGAPTEVANRMADAVTYLSRVAKDAGMRKISAELLLIRKRLAQEADGTSKCPDKLQGRVAARPQLGRIK
jgi:hypothetical protein